jgi:hypothetical protein
MKFDMCEVYLNLCIKSNIDENRLREGLKDVFIIIIIIIIIITTTTTTT